MKTFSTLLFLIFFISGHAQPVNNNVDKRILLFEEFSEGKVLLKTGRIETAALNYNTDNQSMVFMQQNQYMILTALETIDTIYLKGKKFVPVGNNICEVVTTEGPWNLLATYANKLQPITATTDKSGTAQKSTSQANNTVTNVYVGRNYKGNYQVQLLPQYWIRYKGKLYRVANKRQLLKNVNPESRSAIDAYLYAREVSFEKEADMIALLHFVAQAK